MSFWWVILIFCSTLGACVILINRYWQAKLREKAKQVNETEAQLIQMEKMASIGILAAGIAHEINNPLSFLISNLEFMQDLARNIHKETDLNEAKASQILPVLQEAKEGVLRIKRIVQDMRTFSRKSESEKVKLNVNQMLDSTLTIIWNEIKYKAAVIKDYQAQAMVEGDPAQLTQVFLNILINASQALEDKGTIRLSTFEGAGLVCVKISDTGKGIAKEVLPRIFDPFFSTKKSTGLGLSVSYNIIRQHKGDIKVESEVDKGTTFIVELPKVSVGEVFRENKE